MSLLFARHKAAVQEFEDSEWVFVHEESCNLTYKDAVLSSRQAAASSEDASSDNTRDPVDDLLPAEQNENFRGVSLKKKKHKRR